MLLLFVLPSSPYCSSFIHHSCPACAQRLTEALQQLCQAYDMAPESPVVLNLLAHHCLLRGDYAKARLFCRCHTSS